MKKKREGRGEEPSIYYFCLFGAVSVQLMHHRNKVDYIGGHGYDGEGIKTNE